MDKLYGLTISNWMIWVTMAAFIIAYFVVIEILNKKEDKE